METISHFDGKGNFYAKLFGSACREAVGGVRDAGLAVADFVRVSSIEDCVERIEKLGGHVIIPKKAVPGAGYFAVCLDTENRAFGLWQDKESASF